MRIDAFVIAGAGLHGVLDAALRALETSGFDPAFVQVQTAQPTPRHPAIGRALAHAMAMSRFLCESDGAWCLMLDDDIRFTDTRRLAELLPLVLLDSEPWSVLLLASSDGVPTEATRVPGVYRVLNAHLTSAYIVHRRFAPTLIRNHFESAERMSAMVFRMRSDLTHKLLASDQAWTALQAENRFLAFLPPIATPAAGAGVPPSATPARVAGATPVPTDQPA